MARQGRAAAWPGCTPSIHATLAAGILLVMPALAAGSGFRFPLPGGSPTAYFSHSGVDWNCGSKTFSGHKGTDYAANLGTPVHAAAAGTVIERQDYCQGSGCVAGWGNYVRIEHADGNVTIYAHLQFLSVTVNNGDTVGCGEQIGKVGDTSNVPVGAHLHFEVKDATGVSIDPFQGPCSSGSSFWNDQGAYLGQPSTACDAPPPPPPPPPEDSGVSPARDEGITPPHADSRLPSIDIGTAATDSALPQLAADVEHPSRWPADGQASGMGHDGAAPSPPGVEGGCSCRAERSAGGTLGVGLISLLSLLAMFRRRGRPPRMRASRSRRGFMRRR